MFFDVVAINIDEITNEVYPEGAVEALLLMEGEIVGGVTLIIEDGKLATWGGDISMWASKDLIDFLEAAEDDDDFDRDFQIAEIVGAVREAWLGVC